jgi:hypothetical protein
MTKHRGIGFQPVNILAWIAAVEPAGDAADDVIYGIGI